MSISRRLVLGTRNRKKAVELVALLEPHGFQLHTLDEFPGSVDVEETGSTFAENAALKATQQAKALDAWVLGEDSGLTVGFLRGAPGVYSARFAGPAATDAANNARLLEELVDTPLAQRSAHYVCHISVSDPQGVVRASCEAYCHGRIRRHPAGEAGFGYDPLFEVVEYHRTFGQLGEAVKSVISHRARALRQIVPQLVHLASSA